MQGQFRLWAVCIVISFLLLMASPTAARSPTIKDIEPLDVVFVHEKGLNLSRLRDPGTNNPITSLRAYENNNPDKAVLSEISVVDDTDVDLLETFIEVVPAIYYGYNNEDGTTDSVIIREPEIVLGATLAAPYHDEDIEGISIPEGTAIAFRIDSRHVGTSYRVGSEYPARADIVITLPGGAEVTVFGGQNLADIPINEARIYTDDVRGPVVLSGLERGQYMVQAKWREPAEFADYADDSNMISFTVGTGGIDITQTPTETPTIQPTATELPTETPPPEPTAAPTTAPPTEQPTVPETTAPPVTTAPVTPAPSPAPTPAPLNPALALAGIGVVVVLARRAR